MKKLTYLLLVILCVSLFFACKPKANSQSESQSNSVSDSVAHVHDFVNIIATESTCSKEGNIAHFYCKRCKKYYLDSDGVSEISLEQTKLPKIAHDGKKTDGTPSTCTQAGTREHWTCTKCGNTFADEQCAQSLVGSKIEIPPLSHDLYYVAETPVSQDNNGQKEHWKCESCNALFLDEDAQISTNLDDLIIYSLMKIPDFIVDVPSGVDPIVLQLTDTQIIDGSQSRPTVSSGDRITYSPDKIPRYCYDYLTEIIQETDPHLILITGDLIYGKYDDNGTLWQSLISFMDSFEIPWAPVFGNHENESAMGSDWQSQQLENAQYCLFKQRQLTGNGNYSVAIRQNGVLTRIFYMLDSNGCSNMSAESRANGHTTSMVGFGDDQIEWYTKQITTLKEMSPNTKISFAYHIQQAVFSDAFAKYGFNQSEKEQDIFIDYLSNKSSGDFGYIGRQMKTPWDSSREIYQDMKALGVDSIFVGHEHCNSASVVYEGIRFQYGQKSSEYDRYNCADSTGVLSATYLYTIGNKTPIVGGSVVVLSQTDGTIKDAYIYYCESAGQGVNFGDYYG